MSRAQWLALLLGLLLVCAPLVRAEEEEYEDDKDDADEEEGAEAGSPNEKDVVVITAANWEEKVKKTKYALVEFYAPWCGHCQKLVPEYAKAATVIKEHDATITIGKVDATKETELASKHEVSGYPSIKWFVDGEVAMDYNGARDADGIVRWIKKKTGPAAVTLTDKAALADAEKNAALIMLAYFKELKGADYEAFTKVAQKSEDAAFYETTDAAIAKAAGLSAPGIIVISNFEGEDRVAAPLKGKVTEEAITELLTSEKLPPTVEFNDKNSAKIFGAGIDKQLLLIAKPADLKKDAAVYKAFRGAAVAHKGKVVFVLVDMDSTHKDPVTNFFGVKEDQVPVIMGFDMAGNKKYRFAEKITEKAVKAFATGLVDGKLTPEYKSAPIPEEPLDGGVSVVVGKSFDTIVKDETKDVLLEVYAPWCGHCKQLDPIYKKLAKRFAKIDGVVIAKMDGTENEHADVEVKGFPTIVFFPAGKDAKPIPMEGGDRSLKALTKFIKKHATNKFELPKKKESDEKEDKEEEEETKDELCAGPWGVGRRGGARSALGAACARKRPNGALRRREKKL